MIPDELTNVKTAEELYFPWEKLSDIPVERLTVHRETVRCAVSIEAAFLSVAEKRSEEVLEGEVSVQSERAEIGREEERGVAEVKLVRSREMKVTFNNALIFLQ